MKRALKYLIIAAALASLLAFLALAVWLFSTNAGTRSLLDHVSRYTGLKMSATKIEGRLTDTLRLENLEIEFPQARVRIQYLEMTLQSLDLIAGTFIIQNLSLRNVSISDHTPDKPPDLIWPKASGLAKFFNGQIRRLDISNLTYRHLDKEPLQAQTIAASVAWMHSRLSVNNLHLLSDLGGIDGNILAGFNRPLLEMDLTATSARPLAGMESSRLGAKFGPGNNPGELAGNLYLSGRQRQQVLWQLSADAGMTAKGFPLKNIRLHRPDRKGLITAQGLLAMSGPEPFLTLTAQAADIDLAPELKVATNLSGSLIFAGSLKQYRGQLALANKGKGWQSLRLAGDYSGNPERVTVDAIKGTALGGALAGHLNIGWQNGLEVKGALTGRNLNPEGLDPHWAGVINFDLTGRLSAAKQEPPSGEVFFTLRESRLHGQQLTGDLRATFDHDDIRIQHLALQGKGFQVNAQGAVRNRVDFSARVSDLSRLIPRTTGRFTAQGWTRWQKGRLSGVISAEAGGLNAGGWQIASANLTAAIEDKDQSPVSMNATLNKLHYQHLKFDTATLQARGTVLSHTLAAALRRDRYEMQVHAAGSYRLGAWQGKVLRLDGTDSAGPWRLVQPAALWLTANSLSVSPLIIAGRGSETLRLSAKLAGTPLTGSLTINWTDLNLARTHFWTNQEMLTGSSSGNVLLNLLPRNQIALTGKLSLAGTIQAQGQSVNIRQSEMTVNANEQGTRAALNVHLAQGGTLQGTFASSLPAGLTLPDEGNLNLQWQNFDLTPVSTWLPGRVKLEGKMSGTAAGRLLPDHRFSLTGKTALTSSRIHWQGKKGDVGADLRSAALSWTWQDEALRGEIVMTLAEYGKLQGRFRLPVGARLPVAMDASGSFEASLAGQVREKGALSILFPGLIQESHGDLDLDLKVGGSWAEPLIFGTARLSKAGGYLPTAGIAVKDAQIAARFDRDTIHIDSFRAVSGPGYIDGSALLRLKEWQVVSFEGRLGGERFQTIYFPELQVQSSPKLTFTGTTEKISIRGDLLLPQVQVVGSQAHKPVEASPDVVREGKKKPAAQKLPIALDVQVKVILGDSVSFKASGIDAQLGGQLDLQFQDPDKVTGRGEIRVVKGRFRTYGVNLDIVRGRLFYAGGAINQPSLDILAWRKVGDIRAGVLVTGTLQNHLVKLYSEPFMQDMDILAYIVLGHPLGSSSEQASLMAVAAGALLTSQQSETIQRQIKSRLGLDTFEISADVAKQDGYMGGYKRVNVAPTGTGGINSAASVSETMLVVGKYLTPKLYISYGRSLFSGGNLFFMRYDVSKSWQVETQTGKESGVDIYYKFEFN